MPFMVQSDSEQTALKQAARTLWHMSRQTQDNRTEVAAESYQSESTLPHKSRKSPSSLAEQQRHHDCRYPAQKTNFKRSLPELKPDEIGGHWQRTPQRSNLPDRDRFYLFPGADIIGKDRYHEMPRDNLDILTAAEVELCSYFKLAPGRYLAYKDDMFAMYHSTCTFDAAGKTVGKKGWSRMTVQKIGGLDVTKLSRIWAWYDQMGLWDRDWRDKSV